MKIHFEDDDIILIVPDADNFVDIAAHENPTISIMMKSDADNIVILAYLYLSMTGICSIEEVLEAIKTRGFYYTIPEDKQIPLEKAVALIIEENVIPKQFGSILSLMLKNIFKTYIGGAIALKSKSIELKSSITNTLKA